MSFHVSRYRQGFARLTGFSTAAASTPVALNRRAGRTRVLRAESCIRWQTWQPSTAREFLVRRETGRAGALTHGETDIVGSLVCGETDMAGFLAHRKIDGASSLGRIEKLL